MSNHSVERYLPYAPDQLFDLVIDVEHYPEFVPWWIAASVWHRESNMYRTCQVIGLPFLRHEFQSTTTFSRPGYVNISSTDHPFKNLDMRWLFVPAADGGSTIRLCIDCEFHTSYYTLLSSIISGEEGIKHLINAFENRAKQLFGGSFVFVPSLLHPASTTDHHNQRNHINRPISGATTSHALSATIAAQYFPSIRHNNSWRRFSRPTAF